MLKYIQDIEDMTKLTVNANGTEEVILNEAQGTPCLPSLDIRYGEGEDSILQQNQVFKFRPTGGGAEGIVNGAAFLEGIKGNTIAWNQLLHSDLSDSNNYVCKGETTASYSNGELVVTVKPGSQNAFGIYASNFVGGHKVYTKFIGTIDNMNLKYGGKGDASHAGETTLTSTLNTIRPLANTGSNKEAALWFFIYNTSASEQTIIFKSILLFDLTLIYGAGNEPSTPKQFEADYFKWFGKPLTYELYDEGSLRSVKMQGIKSVGFNQWDEEWELFQGQITSKNLIRVLPNIPYFFKVGSMNIGAWGISFRKYDANGNLISNWSTVYANTQTFSEDVSFIKFRVSAERYGSSTYNNDICINISNTAKNGTYETHWSETRNISITTLTGKVNGQGESVVVFPDGMLSAGSVHDEIYKQGGKTYAIKRVGRVDLGRFNYTKSLSGLFTVAFSGPKGGEGGGVAANALCGNYLVMASSPITGPQGANPSPNMVFALTPSTAPEYYSQLFLNNLSYTDVTIFKTAMSGVYLNYELAEPIIYELDNLEHNIIKRYITDSNGVPTQVVKVMKGENKVYEYNQQ